MAPYPLLLSLYGTVSFLSAYSTLVGFFLLSAALAAIGLLISALTENQAVAAGLCFVVLLLLYFMSDLSSFVPDSASASLTALILAALMLAGLVRLLTKSTPAAVIIAIVGVVAAVAGYLVAPEAYEGLFAQVAGGLSVFERFYSFVDGVFDLTAVVYDLTLVGAALFLTVQAMEKRRWS